MKPCASRSDLVRRAGRPGPAGRAATSRPSSPRRAPARRGPRPARGRLIFALDATMSRQPTWDLACQLQAAMFDAAAKAGGLEVQLVYFRGHGEARASGLVSDAGGAEAADDRHRLPRRPHPDRPRARPRRARRRRRRRSRRWSSSATPWRRTSTALCQHGGRARRCATPAPSCSTRAPTRRPRRAFREIARLTGGAYLPFDARAAGELRALLAAVGAYAAGGRPALEAAGTGAARRLLADLRP